MNPCRLLSIRYVLILLLLSTLTACVYSRLLEVKNQLAEFDDNFGVKVESGHFVLDFKHPVLYDSDFISLTHLNPSRTDHQGGNYQWYLDFSPDTEARTPKATSEKIVFCMTFGTDRKLRSWDFSPLFLQMAPAEFLEASIRSLGKGTILQSKRQLKVDYKNLNKVTAEPPSLSAILNSLGNPAKIYQKGDLDVYVYRFKAESTATDSGYEDMRLAEAKLYIDPHTKQLAKMSSRFAGLRISVDFRKMTESSAS